LGISRLAEVLARLSNFATSSCRGNHPHQWPPEIVCSLYRSASRTRDVHANIIFPETRGKKLAQWSGSTHDPGKLFAMPDQSQDTWPPKLARLWDSSAGPASRREGGSEFSLYSHAQKKPQSVKYYWLAWILPQADLDAGAAKFAVPR